MTTTKGKRAGTKTAIIPADLHADLKEIAAKSGYKLAYLIESYLRVGVTRYATGKKAVAK